MPNAAGNPVRNAGPMSLHAGISSARDYSDSDLRVPGSHGQAGGSDAIVGVDANMTESLHSTCTDERSFVISDLHGNLLLSLHKRSEPGGPLLYDQTCCVVVI